ncbi:SidE phosphodiesterase domain-containing protein [Candidatus Berkiella aquae]|nr:SidE phosphodiesterase domain-containing protein [Candidatus Berkiella aquae]MCS5711609.1 hypothetical protein [Candidatus Berkiella aquae]
MQKGFQHKNISNLTKYFYQNANQLIEETYLQPYNGRIKAHLRDGQLEREHHGALHASRVSLYVKVLHRLICAQLPDYAKHALNTLTEEWHLTEKEIINLASFAGLAHDSGRKADGIDYWDKESGENCTAFLIKKGISPKIAKIVGAAAAYKDHPNDYANVLKKQGISAKSIPAYQYLRKLIYLADCYDIMRVRSEFQLEYVFRAFRDINEYQAKKHNPAFIEFAQQVHALISAHQDMRQRCDIVMPGGEKIVTKEISTSYSLSEKIRFEHADNVLLSAMQSMKTMPYFALYLSNELNVKPSKMHEKPEQSWFSLTNIAVITGCIVAVSALYFSASLGLSLGFGLAAYLGISLTAKLFAWYAQSSTRAQQPVKPAVLPNHDDKLRLTKAPQVIYSLNRCKHMHDNTQPICAPLKSRMSRYSR